jgi:hypothetical protein
MRARFTFIENIFAGTSIFMLPRITRNRRYSSGWAGIYVNMSTLSSSWQFDYVVTVHILYL